MKNFKTYKDFSVDKSIAEGFMNSQIDQIAQAEFGMDYDQLGKGEKEWVRDEIDNMTESVVTEAKVWTLISGRSGFVRIGGGTTLDLKDALKFKNIKDATKASKEAMRQGIPNMVHVMNESLEEKEGVKHYTKDGKEWTGATHKMPNGKLMTQNPHNEDSEELFHKEDLSESVVNEADINKLHKPFVDDIYKAVGVIDKILSKNKPPKVPKDIWGKLYGLAGDITDKADELLTLKESVNEAAPRITNSKETDALLDLRDMVANSSKGGSSRYSKEFDKAKTKALRAIEQMLTYTKIGV